MSVESNLQLPAIYPFSPVELVGVSQLVPVDDDNYIPLYVQGEFPRVAPTLTIVGRGVVEVTLNGKPFGFVRGQDGIPFVESQLTESMVLAAQDGADSPWALLVKTPEPLDDYDSLLFLEGLGVYISSAAKKVHELR